MKKVALSLLACALSFTLLAEGAFAKRDVSTEVNKEKFKPLYMGTKYLLWRQGHEEQFENYGGALKFYVRTGNSVIVTRSGKAKAVGLGKTIIDTVDGYGEGKTAFIYEITVY